jgi:hypothetical protein
MHGRTSTAVGRRLSSIPLALSFVLFVGGALGFGCGGASSDQVAKEPGDDPETELARSEAILEGLLGPIATTGPARETMEGGVAPTEPGPQAAPPPVAPGNADALSADERCERACNALGSMRNAVDRLCHLSDDAGRCENARERLTRAAERVQSSCPTCET